MQYLGHRNCLLEICFNWASSASSGYPNWVTQLPSYSGINQDSPDYPKPIMIHRLGLRILPVWGKKRKPNFLQEKKGKKENSEQYSKNIFKKIF